MSFLHTAGFLFLFAIPVIILLYLLKLKRTRIVIPSLILWQRSIQDLIANTPFQRLRANIFLFLQILAVILLTLGIARPLLLSQPLKKRTVVLVIDRSASMKALNKDNTTRLEKAKQFALTALANLKRNDVVMLIAFDSSAYVLQGFTNDKKLVKEKINRLTATDTVSNARESFSIISSIYETNKDLEVVLFSDGRIQDMEDFTNPLPDIEYVRIGDTDYNVGLTRFDIRRNFESPLDFEIFARVENFSDRSIVARVELSVEEEAIDIREAEIKPHFAVPLIFALTSTEQARMTVSLDVDDVFSVDNAVYGVLPQFNKTRIALITHENYFLEKALRSHPHYVVTLEKPSDEVDMSQYDVLIYDGYSPSEPPVASALFFNSLSPEGTVTFTGELENPIVTDVDYQHPITQYTRLENVVMGKAKSLGVGESVTVLAETEAGPLIVLHETDHRKMLFVGFDLYDTNFPLIASFPIFLHNAIRYISRSYIDPGQFVLSTQDSITVTVENPEDRYSIRSPLNATDDLNFYDALQTKYNATKRVGFYETLKNDQSFHYYGVSLVSSEESNIAPAETVKVGREEIIARSSVKRANIEIWHYFVWFALIILILEWLLYWRKTTL